MNVVLTVALLPALFGGGGAAEQVDVRTGDLPTVPTASRAGGAGTKSVALAPTGAAAAGATTTTTTTVLPTTTTTVAHRHAAATATTAKPTTTTAKPTAARAKPATTTTTAPPPPTTATTSPPPPPPTNAEEGRATWYELEGARQGICAHKTLPFGTIVTVTNTRTGGSITCEVGDRGPFVEGYVIDLFRTDFERLAPTSQGWFPAKLTW